MSEENKTIELYDTTLRDGTQARSITVSVKDKLILAHALDDFGVNFIEGGWPGSNPKDARFFELAQHETFANAKITAFGSTARDPENVADDRNLNTLLAAKTPVVCIFGKTWRFHSETALGLTDDQNSALIHDSVAYLHNNGVEVFFDAEHFFDGYKADPAFALSMVTAAAEGGAQRLILCDTNGGAAPQEISAILTEVKKAVHVPIGIHAHNDGELAVANTLAAVHAGAIQVQGTINGIGERCGNANLVSVMANLALKENRDIGLAGKNIGRLTNLAHLFDELTNQIPNQRAPFVGKGAFTHKGGIHVSSVLKDARMYEHIPPESVGNRRDVVISELSGRSNIEYLINKMGMQPAEHRDFSSKFVSKIKELENEGFQFDGAAASLKLMLLGELGQFAPRFTITYAKVHDMFDENGAKYSEAVLKIQVGDEVEHTAADGNGPVNALDKAMRKALSRFYPDVSDVHLLDYKVRVLDGHDGTMAKVRVLIESSDRTDSWSTVGVSQDIIEASLVALSDSLNYKIYLGEQLDRQPGN